MEPVDVLLLGGMPIDVPIAHYGPFVMNTRAEIVQAVEDYQVGRLGTIPADQLAAGVTLRHRALLGADERRLHAP